jgi:hypothetical protein
LYPTPPAGLVDNGPHEDPVKPRAESIGVAESRELLPAADHRFLDRVVGHIRVAQDEPGDRVQPINLAGRQLGERVSIAVPSPFDQLSHPTALLPPVELTG